MGKADDADGAGPQAHHRHKQHEEVQPALVGERNSEDLAPETVGGDHRIGLFFLSGFERLEGVRLFAILKQGVFHGGTVNRTEQCTAKNDDTPIMWKGFRVQLWKPWRNNRKRKIAATPKEGAKNQLLCPKGYIRKTLTNTAIGPEKAMAL